LCNSKYLADSEDVRKDMITCWLVEPVVEPAERCWDNHGRNSMCTNVSVHSKTHIYWRGSDPRPVLCEDHLLYDTPKETSEKEY
jgi:hypothetical protein